MLMGSCPPLRRSSSVTSQLSLEFGLLHLERPTIPFPAAARVLAWPVLRYCAVVAAISAGWRENCLPSAVSARFLAVVRWSLLPMRWQTAQILSLNPSQAGGVSGTLAASGTGTICRRGAICSALSWSWMTHRPM